tara:strand:+ start:1493 stop:2761 length:1269 start_codon:yes stop_codon:yes gene_type:complete
MTYDMELVLETQKMRADIQNMRRTFEWGRPASSSTETEWVNTYLFTPEMQAKGMYKDGFEYRGEVGEGNCIIQIGEGSKTLFSCHTDTVHRTGIIQDVFIDLEEKVFKTNSGQCLGGDDGSGVWLMIELIKANVPGLYIFHRAEEVGGQGSSFIANETPELITGYYRAIAFDRKDVWSIITHQACTRTCSDDFAEHLAEMLDMGHRTDSTGSFTDTANYDGIIPECTNLSVGYYNAHSARENQKYEYLREFRDALIGVEWENLKTIRDPDVPEYSYGGYYGYGGKKLKPPSKTRKQMGWNDWDDYVWEDEKSKKEDIVVIDDFVDDDLDEEVLRDKDLASLTDEEWMQLQEDEMNEGKKYDDWDEDLPEVGFFDEIDEYDKWKEEEQKDKDSSTTPKKGSTSTRLDKMIDEEFDWDAWFTGF